MVRVALVALVLAACASPAVSRKESSSASPPVIEPRAVAPAPAVDPEPEPDPEADLLFADCVEYDNKNPACRALCPGPGTSAHDCSKCPSPPDANIPSCQYRMPCPTPPDPRVRACRIEGPDRYVGRIIRAEVIGASAMIKIALGRDHGVSDGWIGEVLDGNTDVPLRGASVELVRITPQATYARTNLPVALLTANPRVRLHAKQ